MSTRHRLALAAALAVLLGLTAAAALADISTSNPQPNPWPQVTRTLLTTQAGDAYLTTAVIMPEDLDR